MGTTMDAAGNDMDPVLDEFEVFIGTTRVVFKDKDTATQFCMGYAKEIGRDLTTAIWDAEELKNSIPEPEDDRFRNQPVPAKNATADDGVDEDSDAKQEQPKKVDEPA